MKTSWQFFVDALKYECRSLLNRLWAEILILVQDGVLEIERINSGASLRLTYVTSRSMFVTTHEGSLLRGCKQTHSANRDQ